MASNPQNQPVLRLEAVEKYYGGSDNVTRALDGVSLTVGSGEFVAVMGPSGSGKTTLLNCVSTIDRPTAGNIYVDGVDVPTLRHADLARFRRERLGFIFLRPVIRCFLRAEKRPDDRNQKHQHQNARNQQQIFHACASLPVFFFL